MPENNSPTLVNIGLGDGQKFYHDVGEISDLTQSDALDMVAWLAGVMQPMTPSPLEMKSLLAPV